jgi:hypothetical protein
MLERRAVVERLLRDRGDLAVIPGLGSCTWDVAACGDHPLNFYMWGAMGGTAMIGLGLALARPDTRVLVLTGDGDMLMGLGSSAVRPVWGWNQWQKCVAPFPSAHSLTACATSFEIAGSSLPPRWTVSWSEPKIGLGSFFFMAATSNVLQPNRSRTLIPAAMSGSERMLRDATSPMAQRRPESSDIVRYLHLDDSIIGRRRAPQARLE